MSSNEAILKTLEGINKRLDSYEEKTREADDTDLQTINKSYKPAVSRGFSSDEAKAMRYFGTSDPAKLVQINVMDPKFKNVPIECKHTVLEFKKALDTERFIQQMFHDAPRDHIGEVAEKDRAGRIKSMGESHFGKEVFAPMAKAFLSTSAGNGLELLQQVVSAQYIDEFFLDRVVEDKFQDLPLPSNDYQFPVVGGSTTARLIAENTPIIDKSFTTGRLGFSAKKFGEYYIIPEELDEDSIVPIIDLARRELVEAQRRAIEKAIINGDADGSHIDADTQALPADVAEKGFNGLRRQALANTLGGATVDFAGNSATAANMLKMRARMGKFAVNTRDTVYIMGPSASIQLQGMPEVLTVNSYGPNATILTGQLGALGGIPIIATEFMRSDLNETGVYDGVTTNRTGILLVNMRRWWTATRRPITLKVQQDLPNQDRWLMASYQRRDFKGMPQSATEVSVVYGVNVGI